MNKICGRVLYNGQGFDVDLTDSKIQNNNFWEYFTKNDLFGFPKVTAIDLMTISQFIYYCDRLFLRETGVDGWKREISLDIPVLNYRRFNKNKELLQNLLNFLTGDDWTFSFFERILTDREKKIKIECNEKNSNSSFQDVCMFSGGLDSYIGAIDLLEKGENPIFVSHYGGSKGTLPYQDSLKKELMNVYSTLDSEQFFQFYIAPKNGKENTTRSRSFLFFSHAIAVASSVNANRLIIPENGFISINVPLTFARSGSSSTRTTHPYYFELFQKLLLNLELDIEIFNPFKFLTKGQMIQNCQNQQLIRETASKTMSCSKPDYARWKEHSEPIHCGFCIPCTIRRAAMLAGEIEDKTQYLTINYSTPEANSNFNAFRLSIAQNMTKNPEFIIQRNGIIPDNFKNYASIYNNGLIELNTFLESIKL